MGHDETPQHDDAGPMTRATEHAGDDKVTRPATGHTWGASVTSLVGPTDETVGAVDVDEPRVQEQQSVAEKIEAAIVAVRKTHSGTHSREVVMDALQRELEARGRWPQPQPWLDAVATEVEAGGVYTTGTDPADPVEPHDTPSDLAGNAAR